MLGIKRIQNNEGEWMEDQKDIANTTIEFFHKTIHKAEVCRRFFFTGGIT